MKKNFVVGSVGILVSIGVLMMGVIHNQEVDELHRLIDNQSEVIKQYKTENEDYIKAIDKLNQRIRDQDGVINQKNERLGELKTEIASKQKEIDELKKKQTPLASLSRGEVSNKRQLNMEVTAYISTCPGCTGFTYSGYKVTNTIYYQGLRVIAANFNKLPLYSIVRIDTNNDSFKAIVLDTGGAIRNSNTIDLLVNSYDEAIRFGRKQATISVLREGKG